LGTVGQPAIGNGEQRSHGCSDKYGVVACEPPYPPWHYERPPDYEVVVSIEHGYIYHGFCIDIPPYYPGIGYAWVAYAHDQLRQEKEHEYEYGVGQDVRRSAFPDNHG